MRRIKTELFRQLACLERLQTSQWINRFTYDLFRRFRCDRFDFYATLRAGHNRRRGSFSIEQNRKINFAHNLGGLLYQHFVYYATSRASLMCHQDLPQHFRGNFPYFFRRSANMHSPFEPVLEYSFASAAGMDLRFDDNFDIAELARDLFRFIEGRRNFTSRRCDIELLQQLLGLVFVNVHLQEAAFPTPRLSISEKVE